MRVKQYAGSTDANPDRTIAIVIKDQGNPTFAAYYFMAKMLDWMKEQDGLAFDHDNKVNPLRVVVCTDNWEIDG